MNKLLPCPFCGFDAELISDGGKQRYYVWCVRCKSRSYIHKTKADAVAYWNSRGDIRNEKNDDTKRLDFWQKHFSKLEYFAYGTHSTILLGDFEHASDNIRTLIDRAIEGE